MIYIPVIKCLVFKSESILSVWWLTNEFSTIINVKIIYLLLCSFKSLLILLLCIDDLRKISSNKIYNL